MLAQFLKFAVLCLPLLAVAAPAGPDGRERRMLTDAEAETYRGVGRLNVAGRRFCTAVLIAPDRILSAAHCLYHPRTQRAVPLDEMRFVAGVRRSEYAALRGIRRAAIPDGFRPDGSLRLENLRADIALLELDEPVAAPLVPSFAPGAAPSGQDVIAIASYARDRSQAVSLQDGCRITAQIATVVALDCGVNLGASGAPVMAIGPNGRRVWAVVSSTGRDEATGDDVTLAVMAAGALADLEARLSETLPSRSSEPLNARPRARP